MQEREPRLVRAAEMAEILSISRSALYNLVERGVIAKGVVRFGPRFSRFDPEAVLAEVRKQGAA